MKERIALALATILTALAIYDVPSWRGVLTDPCHLALILSGATIAALYVTRWLGPSGWAIERILVTLFLAAMPLVYISSWLATGGGAGATWLWVEILGLIVYVSLAVLGFTRSPWFLAAGIAAHGVAWDSWHFRNSAYIPSWYALGCLLVDVGLGIYIAVRLSAWRVRES
jgi:hypothetical protein